MRKQLTEENPEMKGKEKTRLISKAWKVSSIQLYKRFFFRRLHLLIKLVLLIRVLPRMLMLFQLKLSLPRKTRRQSIVRKLKQLKNQLNFLNKLNLEFQNIQIRLQLFLKIVSFFFFVVSFFRFVFVILF